MNKSLFTILISFCVTLISSTNYCDRELCKDKKGDVIYYVNHIGCNHDRRNAPSCPPDAKILPMSTKRKNLILRIHNRLRNRVALGLLPGYPKAIRMPVLRWNDELAYLAELNVQQCKMKHDECRNTDEFKYAGQNLARRNGEVDKNKNLIQILINTWYDEYKDANVSFIDRYRSHPDGKQIGHFTAMMQDRTDSIGCAILRHSGNREFLLACNYGFTNIVGQRVYTKGNKSCSRCRRGCSKIYTGLCKAHEYIEPSIHETIE